MKTIIYGLLLTMLGSHCESWAVSELPTLQELTINSAVLGEKRDLVIYLPAGYKSSQSSYPVLYVTDGDIQGPHTAGTIDYLAKFEQIPQMIVVGIVTPFKTRVRDLTVTPLDKKNPNQLENADRFLAFVEKEVIPFVKQQYRTLDYQILSGTSHGGQFAINTLVKRPDVFQGIIAISPSLYWNNQQLLGIAEKALKSDQLQGRLYVSIANEEPAMTESYQHFLDLLISYPSDELMVKSQIFSNETHNTTVLQGQYAGLKYLFSEWPIPEGVPKTLADLQLKFANRSTLIKTDIKIPEDKANGYAQWLQYLNRQDDALELLKWNRNNYPQSFGAHSALIRAYLNFNMAEEAESALQYALKSVDKLSLEQQSELQSLFM
ncbi:alpha/beta hydrolase [Alteromonas sp. 5E99-2]|uniref:alpha/beta hydrolase n=1 Tax=Alteromonas sp. 5E99-2 TaxID=2817683 RepID=UPI001A995082|nr:alpha/beta hydrolase-fold protein [Alteromonas sp. 5E99-2]MBO1255384.1 alpha/beta hydrolase [Alteromonas sp. 5E99-2]